MRGSIRPFQRTCDRNVSARVTPEPDPRLSASLSTRFIPAMVAAQVFFAVALALIVGAVSVRLVSAQRVRAVEDITAVIAACLMPVIADGDAAAVDAQLDSIMALGQTYEIGHLSIDAATGEVIASAGNPAVLADVADEPGWKRSIAGPREVVRPVLIDGVEVARVHAVFEPVGLDSVMTTPLEVALLVMLATVFISVPWSAWLMKRRVVEPIRALRDSAVELARGQRHFEAFEGRRDEIGQLGATLDWMAGELSDKEERLLASLDSLQIAYDKETRLKAELEKLMRAKSDFVAVASHELKSPLAVVRLYAEMLEEGVYGDLDPEMLGAVASMVSATSRLTSIVSDLMDAALLERGLMPLTVGDVDLTSLAIKCAADATLLASGRGIRVDSGRSTARVWVRGDSLRLRQVLDNLVSNAVKYSYDNSVVSVETGADGDRALVRVIDEGRGMPGVGRETIFELFGRMDYTDDRETAGLGLGLAISARIAEAHHGRVFVERSVQGEGTTFVLDLPLAGTVADEDLPTSVSME